MNITKTTNQLINADKLRPIPTSIKPNNNACHGDIRAEGMGLSFVRFIILSISESIYILAAVVPLTARNIDTDMRTKTIMSSSLPAAAIYPANAVQTSNVVCLSFMSSKYLLAKTTVLEAIFSDSTRLDYLQKLFIYEFLCIFLYSIVIPPYTNNKNGVIFIITKKSEYVLNQLLSSCKII